MANHTYPRPGDRTPTACAQREEHWRRMLARQNQSGLTATEFCAREEIKPTVFSWWAKQLRKRDDERRAPHTTKIPAKKPARSAFVPVRVIEAKASAGASSVGVEVVTRAGHVVRVQPGFDPATLRLVLVALEGRPC